MGMAASQARYLALVARKSNCEYEGQQINQARTALSNQSANLFNQMLGLTVPIPPSTQDFTKTQYSYSDGVNAITIDSWYQLADTDENYNYAVTYHYNANVYTGSQKKLNDPQVQFSGSIPPSDLTEYSNQIAAIQTAQKNIDTAQTVYDLAVSNYKTAADKAAKLNTYADNSTYTYLTDCKYDSEKNTYNVYQQETQEGYLKYKGKINNVETNLFFKDGKYYTYDNNSKKYTEVSETPEDIQKLTSKKTFTQITDDADKNVIQQLKDLGALPSDYPATDVYKDEQGRFAFKSDLDSLVSDGGKGTATILPVYYPNNITEKPSNVVSVDEMSSQMTTLQGAVTFAKQNLEIAQAQFDTLSIPSYVGNCQLTALKELDSDQMAEIAQIIKDMQAQDVNTNITKCFNTLDGTYNEDTYSGGIYSFKLNGTTYYTTYYDLAESANSGEGINYIDGQQKLPYYNATYVSTKIEKTEKALLETDSQGRFTSIRIGDDTVKYTLNMETKTDEAAYQDAMNQYYYENAKYDKMVQDINAKTSIIQEEDRQLELRLKQLDTEQNALSTEMEAVQKVVKDNVEKSFKTFGG